MKTWKDVEQTKTIELIDQVTCDKCGKVIPVDPNGYWIGGGEVSIGCGYGSRFDTEFENHIFDLCDDCIAELSKSLGWVSH